MSLCECLCLLSACPCVFRSCFLVVFRTVPMIARHRQFIIKRSLALIDNFPITVCSIIACCSIVNHRCDCLFCCACMRVVSWTLLIKLFDTKPASVAALFRMLLTLFSMWCLACGSSTVQCCPSPACPRCTAVSLTLDGVTVFSCDQPLARTCLAFSCSVTSEQRVTEPRAGVCNVTGVGVLTLTLLLPL